MKSHATAIVTGTIVATARPHTEQRADGRMYYFAAVCDLNEPLPHWYRLGGRVMVTPASTPTES